MAVGITLPGSYFLKIKSRKTHESKAFEACRKISEKFSKLVLTIIWEGDIVYIVAGDTNETKQHQKKQSTLTIKQQCNPENSRTEFKELKEISEERNHKSKPRKRSEEIFQGRKQKPSLT